jgi:threonine 3-dehydrogenase
MTRYNILVTGASGEIGHGLISSLVEQTETCIVAVDLNPPDGMLIRMCHRAVVGDVLDVELLDNLNEEYDFDVIYHLAALLSTSAERKPQIAHHINVEGTYNILEMAMEGAKKQGRIIKVLYPSSIAVYGLPNLQVRQSVGRVKENQCCEPATMYGANKLYCEHLGRYYSDFYRRLDTEEQLGGIDFRGLRFPGLISALTVPTGGTSDYIPEMLHHAAQGKPYSCFVREDGRLPFMVMPDAITALLQLEAAPGEKLSRRVYNVTSFNPSAGEFYNRIKDAFPNAAITFEPDAKRQSIVDSWPADLDDSAARADWEWHPAYDLSRALEEYLIPTISQRYQIRV